QRHLGQSFFLVASKPISEICTPLSRIQAISIKATRDRALKFARQRRMADIPVFKTQKNEPIGYLRTVELMVSDRNAQIAEMIHPFSDVNATDLFGEIILQMESTRQTLARVVSDEGKIVGLLSEDQLTDPLLRGPLGSLKR
ncbi:hypothetical protein N9B31_09435, partial [Mariniblastus sp.]|nr:hypothetical protein [Mariniblastus sp.]